METQLGFLIKIAYIFLATFLVHAYVKHGISDNLKALHLLECSNIFVAGKSNKELLFSLIQPVFLNVLQGVEVIAGTFLFVAVGFSANEVPEVDPLGVAVFFINTEFCRLECLACLFKGDAVLAL